MRRPPFQWWKRPGSLIPALMGLGTLAVWGIVTQPVLVRSPKQVVMRVDPGRLEVHVRMLSDTLVPRDEGHPGNLGRAAGYIRGQFQAAGARITEQAYQVNGGTYRNVIARFGPETGELIVVGAHYDACGELPAADDNASGVAGLLELAFLLKDHQPLSLPLELVAYTLEEPPHFRTGNMGSARHAQALKAQGAKVRAMLSLEMIGYFADQEGSQHYRISLLEAIYPSRGNYVAVVADLSHLGLVRYVKKAMRAATPLPVLSMNAPRAVAGIDFSDHYPYWDAGYPAAMITDTAFYRNRDYHTEKDTAEKLDYRRMALVVQGAGAAVMGLAK